MKIAMKESIVDVKLKQGPVFMSNYCNMTSYCSHLDYKREDFLIADAKFSSITFSHQPDFITFKRAISFEFDFEDPF